MRKTKTYKPKRTSKVVIRKTTTRKPKTGNSLPNPKRFV
jgi:hypothetical protein